VGEQLAQVPSVEPVGLRAALRAPRCGAIGWLGQLRLDARRGQLLDHESPAGARFHREPGWAFSISVTNQRRSVSRLAAIRPRRTAPDASSR
jgi:hypothetical protein